MKKTILLYIYLLISNIADCQNFNFEYNHNTCSVTNGKLQLSTDHYKEGSKSLCWETNGGESQLLITGFSVRANDTSCANMYIYSPQITNDTILVEFIYNNIVQRQGKYLLNYKGWHEFKRWYSSYTKTLSTTLTSLRFTLLPTNNNTRKIYIDDIKLNQTLNKEKDILGSHWILDFPTLEWVGSRLDIHNLKDPYRLFSNPRDLPLKEPTPNELVKLKTLREQFKPKLDYSEDSYNKAVEYLRTLSLTRNADNTIKGGPIFTTDSENISLYSQIGNSSQYGILNHLKALAAGVAKNISGSTDNFNLLFDYIIDQGLGEGCPVVASSNAYDDVRKHTTLWFQTLLGCTDDERYNECMKAMRWYFYYGAIYNPEDSYLLCTNSDVIYLLLEPMMNIIASEKDDKTAIRDLYAFKRYLERSVEVVPGENNMIKPDGTGFHHKVHYINYMRAYRTWVDAAYWIMDSPFKISETALKSIRKAVITNFMFSTRNANAKNSFALSLCGRSPFQSNHNVSFTKFNFERLVSVGRDCLGTSNDIESESFYNYIFNSNKYSVPQLNFEGFYAYNYSPTGVYRKDDWVITMRAPTSVLWGSEIYVNANRFGRYQSHGSLEVNYSGTDFSASGYPINGTGGGWDWNCNPGTTTVHYTNWQYMMPGQNLSQRHDQYSQENFSGALAFGNSGLFGCKFKQRESWAQNGNILFTQTVTNLQFKKSMHCFDNMVIALGSDITTEGNYPANMPTATNIFQEIVYKENAMLNVNGNSKELNYQTTFTSGNNVIITPLSTGYFIPEDNDDLKIQYKNQTTPKHNGSDYSSPTTTLPAVKGYIHHGTKGHSAKKYHYVVKPAANISDMNKLKENYISGNLYKIEQQDSKAHILSYFPGKAVSYCLFEPIKNMTLGIVKSVSSESLLIEKKDDKNNEFTLAVCNPNLNPAEDNSLPINVKWLQQDTDITITLNGEFIMLSTSEKADINTNSEGNTTIDLTLKDGMPVYINLIKKEDNETVLESINSNNSISYTYSNGILNIKINSDYQYSKVEIINSTGQIISSENYHTNKDIHIPVDKNNKGIMLCRIHTNNEVKTIKFKV